MTESGEEEIPWEGPTDEDFEALGFDTAFGASPGAPGGLGDNDDTPPGGIYLGEDVQVLDAATIGRALAEVEGRSLTPDLPDLDVLQAGLIGIDVGAAAAVVARFDANGRHEIVPNEHDERLTPVQIFFDDDGEQLVGSEARQMAPSAPHRAVSNLKLALADPNFKFEPDSEHGELCAEDVVGLFLKQLVDNAREGGEISHLALAAPAWFSKRERDALTRAAEAIEGLELVGITDECLASAATYSLRLPDLKPRTALVFDLGHAALGVGLVRCASGDIEVLAQAASRNLGSSAWDALLYNEAARKFQEVHGEDPRDEPAAEMDLWLRAESAKKALSQRPQCTLVASSGGKSLKIGFTRKGFENAARGLLEQSIALAQRVRDEAGLEGWDAVDALLLTGGGCKTPCVRRAISREVGRAPERGTGMEEGVAVGALYWGIGERYRRSKG
ncbi:MAG: Hsp70 family protein [Planctomycetes bacterium]|nr:Hsp70 family protein [Planctomycetota bacterium]